MEERTNSLSRLWYARKKNQHPNSVGMLSIDAFFYVLQFGKSNIINPLDLRFWCFANGHTTQLTSHLLIIIVISQTFAIVTSNSQVWNLLVFSLLA